MSNPYNITIPEYIKDNDILSAIQAGFQDCINKTPLMNGWSVAQANQPSIQALQNKMVYWDVISRRRLGVQGELLSGGFGTFWRQVPVWYEIWLIQVSAFMMRTETEITSSLAFNSQDAIVNLQAYVNDFDNGLSEYFKTGLAAVPDMQVVRSTDLRNIDFETDSGLKQKFPQFDFEIIIKRVPLRRVVGMGFADVIEGDTRPV